MFVVCHTALRWLTNSICKLYIINIADNANISSGKLDIASLIEGINDNGEKYIQSSKIYLDDKNQSLQVAFNKLSNKVDTIANKNIIAK